MRTVPPPDVILRDLLVVDAFIPPHICDALILAHRHVPASLSEQRDNAVPIDALQDTDPTAYGLARVVVGRIRERVERHYQLARVVDLSLLCAITGRFRHTLHADNAQVVCPRHGSSAEQLVAIGCRCPDAEVRPNHTSWRTHTALLYLESDHQGGAIVFGGGPSPFDGYTQQIEAIQGRLVISPSSELYYHRTLPVTRGVRYSLNTWFRADA